MTTEHKNRAFSCGHISIHIKILINAFEVLTKSRAIYFLPSLYFGNFGEEVVTTTMLGDCFPGSPRKIEPR